MRQRREQPPSNENYFGGYELEALPDQVDHLCPMSDIGLLVLGYTPDTDISTIL